MKVRGSANVDSGAAGRFVFVDGDDRNSVWWVLVKRSVACFAWRHFDSPISHRIRSSRSSYFDPRPVRINFSVLVRSSFNFGSRPVDKIYRKRTALPHQV